MIRVHHGALWSDDLDRLARVYATDLGATAGPRCHNPARGFESMFLAFGDGARLELCATPTGPPPATES
jgi:lactoylglutathione lyase